MRQPTIPDEEILATAKRLHAEGRLTVRRLKETVGVAERGRLILACQEVRKSAPSDPPAPPVAPDKDSQELSESLRTCFSRLEVAVLTELRGTRTAEMERARLAEAAHAARHEEQMSATEAHAAMLSDDLEEAEEEVGRLEAEILRLKAELQRQQTSAERERSARDAAESARRAEAESHLNERTALNEALSAAVAQAAANADGRSRAEAAAAAAQATAVAAESELTRLRTERAELRTRNEELIKLLATAEADLKQSRGSETRQRRKKVSAGPAADSGRAPLSRREEQ
jgi:chromosome segregation ATPase